MYILSNLFSLQVSRSISDRDISNSLRKKHRSKSICVSAGSLLGSGSGGNKNNADELSSSIEDREHHCLNGIEKGVSDTDNTSHTLQKFGMCVVINCLEKQYYI